MDVSQPLRVEGQGLSRRGDGVPGSCVSSLFMVCLNTSVLSSLYMVASVVNVRVGIEWQPLQGPV